MDFIKIIDDLKQDLKQWKPIPFWSWNDKLNTDTLCKQIDKMKADGIGGYFMHARGGLKTEYLSEEWMKCIEACGDYGVKTDMDSWIYDENGWPSGFAGGKLLECEENRDCYLEHSVGVFDGNATVSYFIDGDTLIRTSDGSMNGEYLNVTVKTAVSTADILNKDVVDRFIGLTHQAYKERLGVGFAEKFRGFFTDEPQYQRWGTSYTRVLADYFKEKYNEDILDGIGLLFVEKKGYRDFRYRYWKGMQELMLHSFAENIYNWCEDNGVELTGHYVEECSLGGQMMCCGGIMPFYEFEHIPGIDWLGRETDNELANRQVSSVACQMGRRQVLTESFGCCGWDVNPTELMRIVGFQFVGGVNLLCHHLLPYSEYGQRKRDYPAHYSHINPWVDRDFYRFNQFVTRLGFLIAQSDETVNVAVLHPIRSAYFDYKRAAESYGVSEIDKHLSEDIRRLSAHGIGYHFIDETVFARHGFVEGNKIGCGKCSYEYLILPHNLTMDKTTETALRRYVKNGGKVLLMGDKPQFLEAEPYSYDYLESNCTFDEILATQPFGLRSTDNELYYTYRTYENTPFIFVQNGSRNKGFAQEFVLEEKYRSFRKLNLETLEWEVVPKKVNLEPSECALLFPYEEETPLQKELEELKLVLDNTPVEFDENTLTVDNVRYSTDGRSFSKLYPVAGLFQKLLQERYRGEIWFRYEFDVHTVPEKICIKVEESPNGVYDINGHQIIFANRSRIEERVLVADVHKYIKEGINSFTVKTDWFQSENVYYALFGENVTESLRNCLAYDSDLEAVYLAGQFGVYTDEPFVDTGDGFVASKGFYIGEIPTAVSEPVKEGLPFFAGSMTVHKTVCLDNTDVILRVGGNRLEVDVTVNGKYAGKILFGELLDISAFTVKGENILDLEILFSNRNKMGPHHYKDNISHFFVTPETFEISGWVDGISDNYSEKYELLTLGCDKDN